MRVLVVGSGGREHALAWKLAQSPRLERLFVAPGNGGTAGLAENVPIAATDIPALRLFAQKERPDLTVVGPEAPLVAGLVDDFAAAGLRAFGPSASAARLEGSKAFAKRFMQEEGIPTAVGAAFRDYEAALAYLRQQEGPLVVKAGGLAAGKGVTVCATPEEAEAALRRLMVERALGPAGAEVVIEERLEGEEVSLLAFCDGRTVMPMLPARDYKRLSDGDRGPNTGGMGGYAPSPHLSPEMQAEVVARILRPAVEGMRRRGTPYVGVLYAGLMLTPQGPRLLEFNCRFGDPEAQVLLPLLESDLLEILLACVEGRLEEVEVRWKEAATACVVLAAPGYPGSYPTGAEIEGLEEAALLPEVTLFHAGTRREDGRFFTTGGRVLAVTARAPDVLQARKRAYEAVRRIRFPGMHYRRDIGEGLRPQPEQRSAGAYAAAGVDIAAGNRAVERMREAVARTYTPAVLAGLGAFGGLFSLRAWGRADRPVLVASTDGVGTKTILAAALGRYESVGHDIVNHCVNDILVQGARPLFFLDYIAFGKLQPEQAAAIVAGCAEACRAVGAALLGGETAEMPGVYRPGAFDLVGTMVGWVEEDAVLPRQDIRPGDVCLGLPSSGLHTNGYSLARRVLGDLGWDTVLPELGRPLGEVLLTPHRAYLREVEALWAAGIRPKAMAHITGGGFPENIPRVLPEGLGVRLEVSSWEVPAIFHLIQKRGRVREEEMYRVFNMGIGLVLLLPPEEAEQACRILPEARPIGRVVPWDGSAPRVLLEGVRP
ncbi:MAG: phosphoribosylamine--glycine ligase [Chloroflexia bacterium]